MKTITVIIIVGSLLYAGISVGKKGIEQQIKIAKTQQAQLAEIR